MPTLIFKTSCQPLSGTLPESGGTLRTCTPLPRGNSVFSKHDRHACPVWTPKNNHEENRTRTRPSLNRLPLPVGLRGCKIGTCGGSRTHTRPVLSRVPLPLGYTGKITFKYEVEDLNPSTSNPLFIVDGLEGRGGNTSCQIGADWG